MDGYGKLKLCDAFEWISMSLDDAPTNHSAGSLLKKILAYAIYLLFWLALSATGFWLIMEIRQLIVELMIMAELNPWAVRGYDRGIIFVLGLGWFISLMLIEHYFRTGVARGRLWHNIRYVASVQAIAAAVVYGIRFLIQ